MSDHISTPAPATKRLCKVQIVVCDDNLFFAKDLRKAIRDITTAQSVDAAIWAFADADHIPKTTLLNADIFFLDVDFPDKPYSGIDVARTIRELNPNAVIVFVSNYVLFAPEGYEVQALRYILKSDISQKLESCLLLALESLHCETAYMHIKLGGEVHAIPLQDILYINTKAHAALVHTQKPGTQAEKVYTTYVTLAQLDEEYGPQGFLRVHKSYLVNARRLQKFQCTEATLDNGEVLPVSRITYAEQKQQFLYWRGP